MEGIRIETTVLEDGSLVVPELKAGEQVGVIIMRKALPTAKRAPGWAKGYFRILPGFDDPIPWLERYR